MDTQKDDPLAGMKAELDDRIHDETRVLRDLIAARASLEEAGKLILETERLAGTFDVALRALAVKYAGGNRHAEAAE